ncbi:uncharacterized protein TNCV_4200212 [Trichonephila clavipes]|nr:uncharacterized protein TNCV_4200212 [Trichonephila clavipes]
MDPMLLCLGKSLVLPTLNVDDISRNFRYLLISLTNNKMSNKSPFAIHKSLIGIGGEPKSVKRLRSGDLLIETTSAFQTKSFLLAKSFLDEPVTISSHKTLNSCSGVISEPDLLTTPEPEVLEGFSNQGVIQVRRITIKKDSTLIPTKRLILTFNSPNLPTTIKAGYLNCKIRLYIRNPLRCFKCQRFGNSQTSCRGQLTCSRCASVGHASIDCSLEQKCVNCSQPHSSDSKLSRKLIAPQLSQTYAQVTKPSIATSTTQTDENITKIKCLSLQLLKPISSVPQPNASPSIPSTSAASAQADLLTSTSPIAAVLESEPVNPIPNNVPSTSNISAFPSTTPVLDPLLHPLQYRIVNKKE